MIQMWVTIRLLSVWSHMFSQTNLHLANYSHYQAEIISVFYRLNVSSAFQGCEDTEI